MTLALHDMDLWELAEERKRIGMEQVAESNGNEWQVYARRFIVGFLRDNPTMHADDLGYAGLKDPEKGSAKGIGNVIADLARDGWIAKIPVDGIPGAFAAKASARSNGQVKLVWKSCAPEWGGQPKTDA